MSGFSPETRHKQIEIQGHRCALLNIEVDVLDRHHCMPKCRGGSNDPKNCIELAGYNAYSVYGLPVEDIHEYCDRKALREGLYLHPETLSFVTRDEMPEECFIDKSIIIEDECKELTRKPKKHKKKHKK